MGNVKKIILTGCNGYLGKELQKELKKNEINFITVGKQNSDLNLNLLNIDDTKKLNIYNKKSILIHCAGFVPKKFADYNSLKNNRNIRILKNLLKTKINNIIFMSSFSVYGSNKNANECVISKKIFENRYLESKIKCEKLSISSKKKIVIIRLPGLFGRSKKQGLIYNYIKSLINKKKFIIKKNYPLWTPLHVVDAAKGIIEILLKKSLKSEIYNVCYKKNFSATDVIVMIGNKFKKKVKFSDNKKFHISRKFNFFSLKTLGYRINEEIINLKNE